MLKALASGLLISAVAISAAFALSASALAPSPASARVTGPAAIDVAAHRIGEAFASLSEAAVNPAIGAAAVRAPKGDFSAPVCATVVWPSTDAMCLATVDGRPAPRVRLVTIGYQAGDNTTVLMRIPRAEVAQR